jgi:endonuclease-3
MIENFKHDHGYREPFKVLISTILSQRTRDENTDEASRKLFSVFPTVESIAAAKPEELYGLIMRSGMYRQSERIVNAPEYFWEGSTALPDTSRLTSIPAREKTCEPSSNISFGKEPSQAIRTSTDIQ